MIILFSIFLGITISLPIMAVPFYIPIINASFQFLHILANHCFLFFLSFLKIVIQIGMIPSVQFSSVSQSCPTLWDPMNCSAPGLPVQHQLPEFTQTHVHRQWCHPAISSSVIPFSSCPQSLPALESLPMSQLFAWGGQSIGVQL